MKKSQVTAEALIALGYKGYIANITRSKLHSAMVEKECSHVIDDIVLAVQNGYDIEILPCIYRKTVQAYVSGQDGYTFRYIEREMNAEEKEAAETRIYLEEVETLLSY